MGASIGESGATAKRQEKENSQARMVQCMKASGMTEDIMAGESYSSLMGKYFKECLKTER
jgi:hypothetical protein